MHILLGVLGSIITILILLNRLTDARIDLGWLNPLLWHKRRAWRKQYEGNPVFKIQEPMDAAALLMTATAKADGDMTSDSKALLLSLFKNEFHLSQKEATDLLIASVHLYGDGEEVRQKMAAVLTPSLDKFSEAQSKSTMKLIRQVADSVTPGNTAAQEIAAMVENIFANNVKKKSQWT